MRLENPKMKETFAYKRFNKRFCDLNENEKSEYFRLSKKISRENNPEKTKEYAILWYQKHRTSYKEYHQRRRTANPEIYKQYNVKYRNKIRGCKAWENTIAFKVFGKRRKDMDPEEFKEYHKYVMENKSNLKNL